MLIFLGYGFVCTLKRDLFPGVILIVTMAVHRCAFFLSLFLTSAFSACDKVKPTSESTKCMNAAKEDGLFCGDPDTTPTSQAALLKCLKVALKANDAEVKNLYDTLRNQIDNKCPL